MWRLVPYISRSHGMSSMITVGADIVSEWRVVTLTGGRRKSGKHKATAENFMSSTGINEDSKNKESQAALVCCCLVI